VASERQISVGGVQIGGGAPVVVQSMTLTKTHDVEATSAQIAALASAGCEVVRCAVPKTEDAEALGRIVRLSPIPVIADIHFNASLALKAIDAGVAAVRINPGNIGGSDKVAEVVRAAQKAGIPSAPRCRRGSQCDCERITTKDHQRNQPPDSPLVVGSVPRSSATYLICAVRRFRSLSRHGCLDWQYSQFIANSGSTC